MIISDGVRVGRSCESEETEESEGETGWRKRSRGSKEASCILALKIGSVTLKGREGQKAKAQERGRAEV